MDFKNIIKNKSLLIGVSAIGAGVLLFYGEGFEEQKFLDANIHPINEAHIAHEKSMRSKDFGIEDSNNTTTKSGEIKKYIAIIGKIELNPKKANHLNPRYAGVVKTVFKSVGDQVDSGTRLATIESNVGLQIYHMSSSVSGTVLSRDITVGEFVDEETEAFSIASIDELWVELTVRPSDLSLVKVGDEVLVTSRDEMQLARGTLFYVSPIVDEATRTAQATLEIENKDGYWRPGMFIDGHLQTESRKVATIVPNKSVFRKGEFFYVLVRDGKELELQEIDVGEKDFDFTEVIGGIEEGETIVAEIDKELDERLQQHFEKQEEAIDGHGNEDDSGEGSHDHE